MFTQDEQKAIVDALSNSLAHYDEQLAFNYKTVSEAMAEFEKNPAISALLKLDRVKVVQLRRYVLRHLEKSLK